MSQAQPRQEDGQDHHAGERDPWGDRQGTASPSLVRRAASPAQHVKPASARFRIESIKLSTKYQGLMDLSTNSDPLGLTATVQAPATSQRSIYYPVNQATG